MAEGKGFQVIVKINLVPVKQYHSGHSLIVQGDSVDEVAGLLGDVLLLEADQGMAILQAFGTFALTQAAGILVTPDKAAPVDPPALAGAASTKAAAPAVGADPDGPASAALLAVVASKTFHSVEELGQLTTKEAKKQLAVAKSKATKAAKAAEKGDG